MYYNVIQKVIHQLNSEARMTIITIFYKNRILGLSLNRRLILVDRVKLLKGLLVQINGFVRI